MKKIISVFFLAFVILISACNSAKKDMSRQFRHYKPDDKQLYDAIVYMDSVFFQAYNTCTLNLDAYGAFYADDIEFYHDKGGLMTSKQDIIDATKKNICGKVTRELVKGSIEVYPIKDFGAIETGLHMFHNIQEKKTTPSKVSKFIVIWQHKENQWKISRVVSLH